jgi:hypothetical protein
MRSDPGPESGGTLSRRCSAKRRRGHAGVASVSSWRKRLRSASTWTWTVTVQEFADQLQRAYDGGGPHAAAKLIVDGDNADDIVVSALELIRRRTVATEIITAARQRQNANAAATATGTMQNRVT